MGGIVMFLDNNEPPLGSYALYALDTNILHSAGARVMVHAPNTLPIPVDHGQDVAPGFSTSVSIKPFLHSRLPQPLWKLLRQRSQRAAQELIVRTCGCRSSALPELPHAMHVPYCGQVVNWREMLRDKHMLNRSQYLPTLACEEVTMERLKNDRGYETDCGCTHPCVELSYHMSTSMSYWPLELYQFDALTQLYGGDFDALSLYADLLFNETFRNETLEAMANDTHSPDRHDVRHRGTSGQTSKGGEGGSQGGGGPGFNENPPYRTLDYNRQQMDRLREASKEIRQNLLRLNVYLEDLSVVKYKQMPAYGLEDLFADIGGTLGLWMGVSVLTVMELIELIVRLTHLFLKAEWKPGHKPEESRADDKDADESESHQNSTRDKRLKVKRPRGLRFKILFVPHEEIECLLKT
nr:hypothetical protein BaRGS_018321 [Batillaria attramentaria]